MDLRRLLVWWTLPLVVVPLPVYSGRPAARILRFVGGRSLPRGYHWAVFVCRLRWIERRAVERCLEQLAGKRLLSGPPVALRD
ncbi:UNVERIFIED_CONTAM: hypothetical protein FKN15_060799 [Acipenser sinensis]